jgi:hypothetical protein
MYIYIYIYFTSFHSIDNAGLGINNTAFVEIVRIYSVISVNYWVIHIYISYLRIEASLIRHIDENR